MAITPERPELQRISAHAVERLSYQHRYTTNLYLDERVHEANAPVGPRFQKIVAPRRCRLVFADHAPQANFGHACRYLFYDAGNGEFIRDVPARFPPVADAREKPTLRAIHEPVQFLKDRIIWHPPWPVWRCPIIIPEGTRYAILFAGMSNKRHLNDMEFLYRTLIDIYGFDPAHITALSYDGTLNTQDGVQTHWPGDGTSYRIKVNGRGDRAGFEAAIDALKPKLKALDTLLIHCNNHGDSDTPDGGITWVPGTSYLCTYPNWDPYHNADFVTKLAQLPKFRQLIVMLEQCHAGGFNAPILAQSPAGATSVASAATEFQNSFVTADGNWDPFARDWIAAQAGHDPFGSGLSFNPDTDGDGRIEAEEAFAYANAVRDPRDSPNFSESSEAGGDIALGQDYIVWWWWCWIWKELLEPHRIKLPPPEYYARLNRLQPEMTKLTASLNRESDRLRQEMRGQIGALVAKAFKD